MSGFIAVHCGAGLHSEKSRSQYNKLSRRAARAGAKVLKEGGNSLEAVKESIKILEDDPLTNAGTGSNLNVDGIVECDAAIMDGKTLFCGGCGAVQKIKNPIVLAYDICLKQNIKQPLGLVPPMLLVGKGAVKYAKEVGIDLVKKEQLVSEKALRQLNKFKSLLEQNVTETDENIELMDTVGAVCVDKDGHVASGCSSGGLVLKRPGRVGQAALYASGVWSDSFNSTSETIIAVSTTGCGEHLVRTQLAKELARDVQNASCPITALHKSMLDNFVNSRYLWEVPEKLGGALVLRVNKVTKEGYLLWAHSTETMSVGFLDCSNEKAKSLLSRLPNEVSIGRSVNVSGVNFTI